jgi:hypothetical protein
MDRPFSNLRLQIWSRPEPSDEGLVAKQSGFCVWIRRAIRTVRKMRLNRAVHDGRML